MERKSEAQKHKIGEDVVLIEKEEITAVFERMKEIENRFDALSNKYTLKIEEEKNNYY